MERRKPEKRVRRLSNIFPSGMKRKRVKKVTKVEPKSKKRKKIMKKVTPGEVEVDGGNDYPENALLGKVDDFDVDYLSILKIPENFSQIKISNGIRHTDSFNEYSLYKTNKEESPLAYYCIESPNNKINKEKQKQSKIVGQYNVYPNNPKIGMSRRRNLLKIKEENEKNNPQKNERKKKRKKINISRYFGKKKKINKNNNNNNNGAIPNDEKQHIEQKLKEKICEDENQFKQESKKSRLFFFFIGTIIVILLFFLVYIIHVYK